MYLDGIAVRLLSLCTYKGKNILVWFRSTLYPLVYWVQKILSACWTLKRRHQVNQVRSVPFSQSVSLWMLLQTSRYSHQPGINSWIEWLNSTNPIDFTLLPFDWDLFRGLGLFSFAFFNLEWAKWQMETNTISVFGLDCDRWPQSLYAWFAFVIEHCFPLKQSGIHLDKCCYKSAGMYLGAASVIMKCIKMCVNSRLLECVRHAAQHNPYSNVCNIVRLSLKFFELLLELSICNGWTNV